MLYRITLAVDVEAGTITEAEIAAHKTVVDAQRNIGSQSSARVTRCEIKKSKELK